MPGDTPRTPTATRATAFAAPVLPLLPFIALTAVLVWRAWPPWLCCAPWLFVAWRMTRGDAQDTRFTRVVKLAVLAAFWCGWCLVVAKMVCLCVGVLTLPASAAFLVYVPFFPMMLELGKGRDGYSLPFSIIMHVFFDIPLTACGLFLREVFGLRLFPPFASIMDDEIVQGSMPFPSDVSELAASPYNVCAVVNMCREWPGPLSQYRKHNITQLHLPTQDTTCPSPADLRRGAAFIAEQLRSHPGKRVYVHCKGGIARASTMVLAHYILNRGRDPHAQIRVMQGRRSIVYSAVANYYAIEELCA